MKRAPTVSGRVLRKDGRSWSGRSEGAVANDLVGRSQADDRVHHARGGCRGDILPRPAQAVELGGVHAVELDSQVSRLAVGRQQPTDGLAELLGVECDMVVVVDDWPECLRGVRPGLGVGRCVVEQCDVCRSLRRPVTLDDQLMAGLVGFETAGYERLRTGRGATMGIAARGGVCCWRENGASCNSPTEEDYGQHADALIRDVHELPFG